MSYMNPPYENRFKELCACMPLFYLDVYEMREILKAQGRLGDGIFEATERVINNNFILLADAETVSQWEAMLEITRDSSMTLDQRKSVIMGLVCGNGHIGEPEIRAIIAQYTPQAVTVGFAKGVIYITIEGEVLGEGSLLETLLRRIPAHLALRIQLRKRRVFRQALSIGFGGAIGAQQEPQFVAEPRNSMLTLHISHGGAVAPFIRGDPHTQPRTASATIQVGHGGSTTAGISAEPHTEPRAVSAPLRIGHGGGVASETSLEPHTEPRMALSPLPVGYRGTVSSTSTGEPPEVKRASTGLKTGGRGVFFQTRIKSKLIKTEEER